MKKNGFTLAEIMITLSIIGVVAALTAPALVNNAANANIIPTVRKAVSTLEQVNLGVINAQQLNSLADIDSFADYLNSITNQMSGAIVGDNNIVHMKGNIDLVFTPIAADNRLYQAQGGLRGHYADVIIDIDGVDPQTDNLLGSDRYQFAIDGSGSVLPYGGRALHRVDDVQFGYWNDPDGGIYKCNDVGDAADAGNPNKGLGCAGSVMENNDINFR